MQVAILFVFVNNTSNICEMELGDENSFFEISRFSLIIQRLTNDILMF